MKKQILTILSIATIITVSCKKNDITPLNLNNGDYFIFGEYAGECLGDCAHFYIIKDNQIYPDLNDYYYSADSLKFNSSSLAATKYNLSKPLLTGFPTYLDNHKNVGFGCPDCSDGGAIYIILKKHGIISTWNVDNDINNQPSEIRSYIMQMHSILTDLQ